MFSNSDENLFLMGLYIRDIPKRNLPYFQLHLLTDDDSPDGRNETPPTKRDRWTKIPIERTETDERKRVVDDNIWGLGFSAQCFGCESKTMRLLCPGAFDCLVMAMAIRV